MQLVNVGTKPVCISGKSQLALFLLTSLMAKKEEKRASVTVYYPVHTRVVKNVE